MSIPDRSERAVEMEARVFKVGEALYLVHSKNSDSYYNVDLNELECECPDYEYRGEICKHQRKAAIADENGEVINV